jgi:adenylyl-sulfate kinase
MRSAILTPFAAHAAATFNHGVPVTDGDGTPVSDDVVWDPASVARDARWRAAGQRGGTLWFTGLPAAGKSTLARALEASLVNDGRLAYRLDGNNLRHGLCGDLGFSAEDRSENVRRTAHVACMLADAGVVCVVALVSPYRADRERARDAHAALDLPFFEVHVATPLEECERRDPQRLYARARAGQLTGMTGVDDPYEEPLAPDLRVTPDDEPADVVAWALARLA